VCFCSIVSGQFLPLQSGLIHHKMQGVLNEKTMHVVCASFVLFSLKSCTQLYNHYRIVEENSLKYMQPDGFFGIQILPNSIWLGLCPRTVWGSSRRSPKSPSRLGRGHSLSIPIPHSPQRLWRLAHNASPLPPPVIWTTRKKQYK